MICLRAKPLTEKTQEYLIKLRHTLEQAPRLDVLLIGDHEASAIYVGRKKKAAQDIGIDVVIHNISDHASQDHIENLIKILNNDSECNGILLQLPLPTHFNVMKLLSLIDPSKDVDGFHPLNKGNHLDNCSTFVPCTALGISRLLKFYNINLQSKHVLILGRSSIVGKPLAVECLHQNATVTIAHSATKNLADLVKQADIIMSATGNFGIVEWDQFNEHQMTPLHKASENTSLFYLVKKLLNHPSIDLSKQDIFGDTALLRMMKIKYFKLFFGFLKKRNYDLSDINYRGENVFHYALQGNINTHVLKELLKALQTN
jgi:methylenetetrahydrofolate dehydrogenase (NADP+)/methenyltetrahydrofolate cyclohydrolase